MKKTTIVTSIAMAAVLAAAPFCAGSAAGESAAARLDQEERGITGSNYSQNPGDPNTYGEYPEGLNQNMRHKDMMQRQYEMRGKPAQNAAPPQDVSRDAPGVQGRSTGNAPPQEAGRPAQPGKHEQMMQNESGVSGAPMENGKHPHEMGREMRRGKMMRNDAEAPDRPAKIGYETPAELED